MIVTKVDKEKNRKYPIYVDDEFMFSLYSKELKQFHIQEGIEISEDAVSYILDTIIYKRAKERALFLLEKKPLSVHMMKRKLVNHGYSFYTIDHVVSFLESYGYLDDEAYVRMYVNSYAMKKSRKQLETELCAKGISRDVFSAYFEQNTYSEQSCFEKQFEKYTRGKNLSHFADRQKIFRYFYNKGFSVSLIEKYMTKEG